MDDRVRLDFVNRLFDGCPVVQIDSDRLARFNTFRAEQICHPNIIPGGNGEHAERATQIAAATRDE